MTIHEVVTYEKAGMHFGNRIMLPFRAHLLEVIVNKKIITDFSPLAKGIYVEEEEGFTNLFFADFEDLEEVIEEHESIKILAVEKGKDVFDFRNHVRLSAYLKPKHIVQFEFTDKDILFIE